MEQVLNTTTQFIDSYVYPVTKKYDENNIEEGKCDATARATVIRAKLGELYSSGNSDDIGATYIVVQSLLADLSTVLRKEAENIPSWVSNVITRTLSHHSPDGV